MLAVGIDLDETHNDGRRSTPHLPLKHTYMFQEDGRKTTPPPPRKSYLRALLSSTRSASGLQPSALPACSHFQRALQPDTSAGRRSRRSRLSPRLAPARSASLLQAWQMKSTRHLPLQCARARTKRVAKTKGRRARHSRGMVAWARVSSATHQFDIRHQPIHKITD